MVKGERNELRWDATIHFHASDQFGAFVAGAMLVNGWPFEFADEGEFVDAILTFRGTAWWFGASKAEFRWLLDRCLERQIKPDVRTKNRGGSVLYLRAGKSQHRDAHGLWPVPLSEFCPDPVPRLGLSCICGARCGGRCAIDKSLAPAKIAKVRRHALATCHAIWRGLERLKAAQAELDLDGRNTLGSTAWASARRRHALPDVEPGRSAHTFAHEAGIGARLEVIRPKVNRALEYDMNMAYTGAEAEIEFPIGESTRLWGAAAAAAFERGVQGLYRADLYSPEAFLPVLPVRSKARKVAFPTGSIRGTWTRDELRYALGRGYKLDRMRVAQVYKHTAPILRAWAQALWKARRQYEQEGSPLESYVKMLAVALPGVFGMPPYDEQFLFGFDPKRFRRCPCLKLRSSDCPCRGYCCERCSGLCGQPISFSRDRDIWIKRTYRLLGRAHAIWHNLIIAWCRVGVHRFAIIDGDGTDIVSINTDGFRCLRKRILTVEAGPGGWRFKGSRVEWEPGAGVVTRHGNTSVAADEATGELILRSSGVPRMVGGRRVQRDEDIARRILGGDDVFDLTRGADSLVWRPVGLRQGLAEGKAFAMGRKPERPRLTTTRDRYGNEWLGPRILEPGSEVTRAPTMDELDALG